MPIVRWEKIGAPATLAEGYGKRLDLQKFKDHQGREVDFYFLERPFWSVILPITKEGKVVMVRHWKPGSENIMDELPAGQGNFAAEDPAEAVRRELKEETGYEAGEVVPLGSAHYDSGSSHSKFYCFLAKGCEYKGGENLDATEQIERIEKPLEEFARDMLRAETDEWDAVMLFLRALPHLGVDPFAIIKPKLPKF